MSVNLGVILFAVVVLLLIGCLIYFVSKGNSCVLKLVYQNEYYEVYELVQPATIAMMYEYLALDFDKLLMTDSAREDFCQKHRDQLSVNKGNFFLHKNDSLLTTNPSNLLVLVVGLKTIDSSFFFETYNYNHFSFFGIGHRLIIPRHKS